MANEKRVKGFFKEFKEFISRGNVLDMAVGVIVGGAFTAIVTALSDHILKPIINWFLALVLGSNSLSDIFTYLKKVEVLDEATGKMVPDLVNSIYIDWGAFINAIINFILIAFVLFLIVRTINRVNEANEKMKADAALRKAAVKKYRAEGLSSSQAKARFLDDQRAEAEAKAAAEAAAAQAAADAAAALAAKQAQLEESQIREAALLEEICTLLKNK